MALVCGIGEEACTGVFEEAAYISNFITQYHYSVNSMSTRSVAK